MHRTAGLAIMLLAALTVVAACGGPAPISTATPTATPTPLLSVSAAGLSAEYSSNAVAAGRKYKGKEIVVTGVVSSVGFHEGSVSLQEEGVVCDINVSNRGTVLNIAKKQQITLKGRVSDNSKQGRVVLNRCAVFAARNINEEEVFATISASELVGEHMQGEGTGNKAAATRYEGQVLEVYGKIALIGKFVLSSFDTNFRQGEYRALYVTLESEGIWDVVCIFPTTRATQITQLATGQLARLRGRYDSGYLKRSPARLRSSMVLRDCTVTDGNSTGQVVRTPTSSAS